MSDNEQYLSYVAARAPALRRTAYLLCGDWHRAEDAVQSTLLALFVKPPRDWGAVDAWVRRVLVRTLIDESRRPWRREVTGSRLPDVPSPSADVDSRLSVVEALRSLPGQQRAVLVLRFWDDLSVRSTAAALEISEGTVKSHTSRGLAALRNALERSSS